MTTSGNSQFKVETMNFGPRGALAWVRWAPSNAATQTLSEAHGVASVTRNSIGNYTCNFVCPSKAVIPIGCGYTATDSTTRHIVRVESHSAANGTATLSHNVSTFASESTLVNVNATLANVSSASSAYVQAPCAGTITKIYATLQGAITVADDALTTAINGTGITNGGMTIAQSGSAAGTKFSATPTALNVVAAGDLLTVTSGGGSTGAVGLNVQFEIQGTGSTPAGSDTVTELWAAFFLRLYN